MNIIDLYECLTEQVSNGRIKRFCLIDDDFGFIERESVCWEFVKNEEFVGIVNIEPQKTAECIEINIEWPERIIDIS